MAIEKRPSLDTTLGVIVETAPRLAVLAEILEERVVSSRGRQTPRGVKRKMSNFPLRPRHVAATDPINYAKCVRVLK